VLKILPFGPKRARGGPRPPRSATRGTSLVPANGAEQGFGAEGWLTVHNVQKSYKKRLVVRGVTLAV